MKTFIHAGNVSEVTPDIDSTFSHLLVTQETWKYMILEVADGLGSKDDQNELMENKQAGYLFSFNSFFCAVQYPTGARDRATKRPHDP